MFPLMKIGSAANALGNALVPRPQPPPRASSQSSYTLGADVLGYVGYSGRMREEADVFAWHAEETWRRASALGRTIGAALVAGGALWMLARGRK